MTRSIALLRSLLPLSQLCLAGCFYVSDYVPPSDGRARVIWRDNHLVPLVAGVKPSDQCANAVANLARVSHVTLWHGPAYPASGKQKYIDTVEAALNDQFRSHVIVRILDQGDWWKPMYYVRPRGLLPAADYPLFDLKLVRGLQKAAAIDTDVWTFELLFSSPVIHHFSGSAQAGYVDDDQPTTGRGIFLILTIASSMLFAPLAAYPLLDLTGSPFHTSYASNIANAYNDLQRTADTPCSQVPKTDARPTR